MKYVMINSLKKVKSWICIAHSRGEPHLMRYRFPVSRRWSPQANPTARHQRTLRDHVIRVGAPRDMPVYFPAFAGTKLYCLVTEAVGCEQLAWGCCTAASRPGLEPATLRSQVRRPTTKPPRHPSSRKPNSISSLGSKVCSVTMQINSSFSNYYKSLGREQRRASQCTRHVYRLDLLLRQRENAKCV